VEIDVLSLFPEYFEVPLALSLLGRAFKEGIVSFRSLNIRQFSEEKGRRADDRPFGGGPGMVMMAGPVVRAVRSVRRSDSCVVYLSPQGKLLTAKKCRELAVKSHLVLLSGHYEGVDERVLEEVDEEISIGDYVLTSGCPAALVLIDAVVRLLPGVVGHPEATHQDSFEDGIFDAPHYTRPRVFEGKSVPPVLWQGDHVKIAAWRKQQAINKTARVRPDLMKEKVT
jgi:tRNA (guanine37-N1)-methyltransferase